MSRESILQMLAKQNSVLSYIRTELHEIFHFARIPERGVMVLSIASD